MGVALATFATSIDFRKQLLGADIDGSVLNPSLALSRTVHAWSFHLGLGTDNAPAIGQIPVYLFESLLQHLGLGTGALQWITYGLVFLLIPFAMMCYLRTTFPERPLLVLVGGLASVFNFYVYLTWYTPVLEYEFGLLGVPLLAAVALQFAMQWNVRKLIALVVVSIVVYGAGANLAVALVMTLAAITLALIGARIRSIAYARVLTAFAIYFGISVGWLLPMLSLALLQQANLSASTYAAQWTDGTLKVTSDASTPLNLIRLIGTWNWDHSDPAGHPYVPAAALYERNMIAIALSFLLPVLAIFSLARRDRRDIAGYMIALLVALFFMKGIAPPLGQIFGWLFSHVPGFVVFRHPYSKFGIAATPLLVIAASFGAEYMISHLRVSARGLATVGMVLLIIASLVPYWTGGMFRRVGFPDMPSYYVSVPHAYSDLADYLKQVPDQTERVLVLPFSPVISYTTFVWGFNGPDPLVYMIACPVITEPRSWSDPYTSIALEGLGSDVRALRKSIDAVDIHFAVIHRDVDTSFYGASSPAIAEQLVRAAGGVFIRSFGVLDLYEFRRPWQSSSALQLDQRALPVAGLTPQQMAQFGWLTVYQGFGRQASHALISATTSLDLGQTGLIPLPQKVHLTASRPASLAIDAAPNATIALGKYLLMPSAIDNIILSPDESFQLTPGSHVIRSLLSFHRLHGSWIRSNEAMVAATYHLKLAPGENAIRFRYQAANTQKPAGISIECCEGPHRTRLTSDIEAPTDGLLHDFALFVSVPRPLEARLMLYGDGAQDILHGSPVITQGLTESVYSILVPPFALLRPRRSFHADSEVFRLDPVLKQRMAVSHDELNSLIFTFIEIASHSDPPNSQPQTMGAFRVALQQGKPVLVPATPGVATIEIPESPTKDDLVAIDSAAVHVGSWINLTPGIHRFITAYAPRPNPYRLRLDSERRVPTSGVFIPVKFPTKGDWLVTFRYVIQPKSNLGAGFGWIAPSGKTKIDDTDLQSDGLQHTAAFAITGTEPRSGYIQIYGVLSAPIRPIQFDVAIAPIKSAGIYELPESALLQPSTHFGAPVSELPRANVTLNFEPSDAFNVILPYTGLLRFSSPFNSEWKAYDREGKRLQQVLVDGAFTGWIVDKPGIVHIVYAMQKYRTAALIIVVLTVVLAFGSIVKTYRRPFGQGAGTIWPPRIPRGHKVHSELNGVPTVFLEAIASGRGIYLDVGAGDGWKLRSILDAGWLCRFDEVWAVDCSDVYVKHLRTIVPEAKAQVGDAQKLPYPDASVNVLFMDQLIEHVPSDLKAAAEIRRVLADDGLAIVGSVLKLPGAWYYYRNNGQWRIDPTHLREYRSEDEFARVFTSVGLHVDMLVTQPVRVSFAHIAVRILVKLGALRGAGAFDLLRDVRFLGKMQALGINIPRYRMVYAQVRKSL